MSVTAVTAISSYNQSGLQQQNGMRQDLLALQNALSAGNLPTAQQALSRFQQDLQSARPQQNGIRASAEVNPQNTMRSDLQALQSALDSGDLALAEEVFQRVLQDGQKATGPGPGLSGSVAGASVHLANDETTDAPRLEKQKSDGNLIDVLA